METETPKDSEPRPPSGRLTILGLALTGLYLAGAIALGIHGEISVIDLKANELGDFLAGVFAPLAFLWLVLGFFLQRQELNYSSRALWLQSEELAKSVEHQRSLAEQTKRQVDADIEAVRAASEEAERLAQPAFVTGLGGTHSGDESVYSPRFENTGAPCSNVVILSGGKEVRVANFVPQGASFQFEIKRSTATPHEPINGLIIYSDARSNRRARRFYMNMRDGDGMFDRMRYEKPIIEPGLIIYPPEF